MTTETKEDSNTESVANEPKDAVWVEKYRPQTIDEIVGQNDITRQLSGYVEKRELPNLLFSGEAGIGKTTSAVAVAKELYGEDWQDNFLELNASDERGIDVVRERIKDFARTSFGGYDYRIIFLDEADSLTADAQAALRRTMEQFSNNVRFIMSCNYSDQIIDPIQSRCSVFRYSGIDDEIVAARLREVADNEGVSVTDEGIDALVYTANGDMRSAINSLQGASVLDREVDEAAVYQITSTPRPEEIEEMIQSALSGEFHKARSQLDDLLNNRGLSGSDILSQVHRLIWEFDVADEQAIEVMDRVGETDYRITEGAGDRIQLEALLAGLAKTN